MKGIKVSKSGQKCENVVEKQMLYEGKGDRHQIPGKKRCEMDKIIVKGAREHNLKNIDIEIPKNQ